MRYIVVTLGTALFSTGTNRYLIVDTNNAGSVVAVAITDTATRASALAANLNANPI